MTEEKNEVEKEIQHLATPNFPPEYNGLKKLMQAKKEEARKARREMAEVRNKMERAKKNVNSLKEEIGRLEKCGTDDLKRRTAERNEQIEILKQEISTSDDQIRSQQTHLHNLINDAEALTNERHERKAVTNKMKSDIRSKEAELRKIRSEKGNRMVLFGESMPRLLAEIQKAKFHRPPIGPIGSEIQLKAGISAEQSQLVEFEIGALLSGFIVDNFDDQRTLNGIQNRLKTNFPVIATKFLDQHHDISNGKCASDFPTMFDLIDCPNVVVSNCLIDQKKLERVIMIPSDEEAQNLLKSRASVPKNLLHAMTHSFTQLHPAPKYRSYSMPLPPKNKTQILSCSVDDLIEGLEREVESVRENLTRHEEQDKEYDLRYQQTESERQNAKKVIDEVKRVVKGKNFELSKLQTEAAAETPPDIEALVEDKEKYEEIVAEHSETLETKTTLFNRMEEESENAKADVAKIQNEHEKRLSKAEPLREQLESLERALTCNEKERNFAMTKKEEYLKRLREAKAEEEEREAKVREKVQDAAKYDVPRPDNIGTSEKLVKEIYSLQTLLKKSQISTESKSVVMDKLEGLQAHRKTVKENVEQLKDQTHHLNLMIDKRKKGFHCIQNMLARVTQLHFGVRLEARGYSGEIKIDYERLKLVLTVNPEGQSDEKRRDMRTLSGGEKSYSTISLILSLWDSMQPPFRILDEFDVFMDMINRRIALDQIIDYAKESKKFQYIFLTPLNTSNIKTGKELSIVRLEK